MTLHEPNTIEILLAIYRGTFHTNYLRSRFPNTGEEIVNDLLKQGLVEMRPDPFDLLISDKGKQFIELLLNTPIERPAQKSELVDVFKQLEELKDLFTKIKNGLNRLGLMKGKDKPPAQEAAGKPDHAIQQGAGSLETFKLYMNYADNTNDRDFEFNIWRAVQELGLVVEEHLAKEQKS